MAKEEKATKSNWPTRPITSDPVNPLGYKHIVEAQKAIKNCDDVYLMPNTKEGLIRGSEFKAWGLDANDLLVVGSTDSKLIEMIERIL